MDRHVLHIISQAHLDPVWLWHRYDGYAQALTTVASAVDRAAEFGDFRYCRSSADIYRWVERTDPRLFAEVKRLVAEGRWEVVNGWIEQPDCNIPSTESFVRQSLYGKAYFARSLGVDVPIGYNVDSFGHAQGLPQLLARAGFRYYVFMRPHPTESRREVPPLFWWKSPDGSKVLAWRIARYYNESGGREALTERIRSRWRDDFAPGFSHGAMFLGIGNHGGGPTKEQIETLLELSEDDSLPELRFSTMGDFFRAVESDPAFAGIPTVDYELQHHARGCYAAHGEIKRTHRRAERALVAAEALASASTIVSGAAYPAAAISSAWWETLFNQFHDILAGTCIPSACDEVLEDLGGAVSSARRVSTLSVQTIARRVDARGIREGGFFIMNPLPWARRAMVLADADRTIHGTEIARLVSEGGVSYPVQWIPSDTHTRFHMAAVVDLPGLGWRSFSMEGGPVPLGDKPKEVRLSPAGFGLASLPATGGAEFLAAPMSLVVVKDESDTWAHGVDSFRDELGRVELTETEVEDDGPVLRTVVQRGRWRDSLVELRVRTWAGVDAVELALRTNWRDGRTVLKLELPLALAGPRNFARTPGGVTERPAGGEEEPAQDWVAVEGELAGLRRTAAVISDSTMSYDCLGTTLHVTVLRTARYAEHDPVKERDSLTTRFLDTGWQERQFWIVAGDGGHGEMCLTRLADEFTNPSECAADSAHPGTEPRERGLIDVQPRSVAVTAFKAAEDGRGFILRLEEMTGRRTGCLVETGALGIGWRGEIGPWEIATLRMAEGRVERTDLLERPGEPGPPTDS